MYGNSLASLNVCIHTKMPTPDASQFTRFKRVSSVQRVQYSENPQNSLTEYASPVSGITSFLEKDKMGKHSLLGVQQVQLRRVYGAHKNVSTNSYTVDLFNDGHGGYVTFPITLSGSTSSPIQFNLRKVPISDEYNYIVKVGAVDFSFEQHNSTLTINDTSYANYNSVFVKSDSIELTQDTLTITLTPNGTISGQVQILLSPSKR